MPADLEGPDAAAPQPVRDDEERLRIDGIAMVRLLGPQDRLLTSIQREYPGVEVHVRGNEIAIRGDADQLHELRLRGGGHGHDGVRPPRPEPERVSARMPVPERERPGVPEQGEVVHRHDDRDACAQRPPEGRAVENVEAARRAAESDRVPGEVAGDRGETARTAKAERDDLKAVPGREGVREALHDPGRPGAGLGERGGVEPDSHPAAS